MKSQQKNHILTMNIFKYQSLSFSATLWVSDGCSGRDIPSSCLAFLMPTPFPLLPIFTFFQRRCRPRFLFLLQAAQRVGVALFPLPLLPPSLSVLQADALLLFQAADALVLGRAHQFSQLDGLDVVKGRLARLVQHHGVEDDVEQGDTGDLLQTRSHRVVLENKTTCWLILQLETCKCLKGYLLTELTSFHFS